MPGPTCLGHRERGHSLPTDPGRPAGYPTRPSGDLTPRRSASRGEGPDEGGPVPWCPQRGRQGQGAVAGSADQQAGTALSASAAGQSPLLFSVRTVGFGGSAHGHVPALALTSTAGDMESQAVFSGDKKRPASLCRPGSWPLSDLTFRVYVMWGFANPSSQPRRSGGRH